ncbi:MAG TPA: indole-3-glycerol phosphate synthase TrpC, partial [Mobilitalea sp.]|nr:indole-3-glycerol phosphate synthase TrpC [Mobilitalea sp.]
MDNILNTIAKATKLRVENSKERLPLSKIKEKIYEASHLPDYLSQEAFPFEKALKKPGISFICEVKKASPSKGIIDPVYPYIQIAKEYEKAEADAVSVLTEPDFFKGDNEHLQNIRKNISLPILRKDFTVDEYQIYEAKYLGADAVLLICALLDEENIKNFISI